MSSFFCNLEILQFRFPYSITYLHTDFTEVILQFIEVSDFAEAILQVAENQHPSDSITAGECHFFTKQLSRVSESKTQKALEALLHFHRVFSRHYCILTGESRGIITFPPGSLEALQSSRVLPEVSYAKFVI